MTETYQVTTDTFKDTLNSYIKKNSELNLFMRHIKKNTQVLIETASTIDQFASIITVYDMCRPLHEYSGYALCKIESCVKLDPIDESDKPEEWLFSDMVYIKCDLTVLLEITNIDSVVKAKDSLEKSILEQAKKIYRSQLHSLQDGDTGSELMDRFMTQLVNAYMFPAQ